MISFDEFIKKYDGKKIDYDGFYGGQCVDLFRQYVKEVLAYPQSPGVGGATEIWDSADPDYYDFIKNTPTGVPVKGDIPIWNRNAGGGFGHVAVFIEGNASSFVSFDQNWRALNVCERTNHNYTNVIGWLHPKGSNMANGSQEEIDQLKTKLAWYDKEYPLEQQRLVDEKKKVADLQGKLSTVETQLDELDNTHKGLLRDLANKLGTTQDISYIAAAVEDLNNKVAVANETLKLRDAEIAAHLKEASKDYGSSLTSLNAVLQALMNAIDGTNGDSPPIVVEKPFIQKLLDWFFRR